MGGEEGAGGGLDDGGGEGRLPTHTISGWTIKVQIGTYLFVFLPYIVWYGMFGSAKAN